jgi:hypothetical protein
LEKDKYVSDFLLNTESNIKNLTIICNFIYFLILFFYFLILFFYFNIFFLKKKKGCRMDKICTENISKSFSNLKNLKSLSLCGN